MPLARSRPVRALAAALVALFLGGGAPAPPSAAPSVIPAPTAAPPGFAELASRLLPAVVNITATTGSLPAHAGHPAEGPAFDKRFREFMRGAHPLPAPAPRDGQSLGSGFIIDPSGLIVTNNHVIAGARRIAVTLQDGTVLAARVVGRDRIGDLALLAVDAGHPLPVLHWGQSDTARVGDWVVAIGNPFGLGGTVTAGIISARGRDIHDGPYDDFIQTDAPINRGNSGGPLFDLAGRVIGVTTAIYSPTGGSVGIGFAIPADIARIDIDQLRRYGHPRRGWLGLQAEQVTATIARGLGLPGPGGALVAAVAPGGPAATAGVRAGDVILRFEGIPLQARTLPRRVAGAAPGSQITLLVWRNGQPMTLHAELGTSPEAHPHKAAPAEGILRPATPAARPRRAAPG